MDPTNPRPQPPDPQAAEAADPPSASAGCDGFQTAPGARHRRRFNLWMIAVAVGYVGAAAALRWRAMLPAAISWLLVATTLLFALLAVRSYLLFLRAADELLRRIQTEALALGFGAGAVFALFYPLVEKLGAPAGGENATAAVMMLAWGIGSWLGTRRYSGTGGG